MQSTKDGLGVSEHFYSVQGEGPTMGKRAVFFRLKGCNLLCGGQGTVFDKKLHDGATWRCDTVEVWLKGEKLSYEKLLELFFQKKYIDNFNDGAHLVVTGGEPFIQQKALAPFLNMLRVAVNKHLHIEIETNGTIFPESETLEQIDQVNLSPKLSNSGMPREKRYKQDVLDAFCREERVYWKFVITRPEDLEEIEREFLNNFPLKPENIWLMPGASNRDDLEKNSSFIVDACKQYGFNFSSRLQVAIWNLTTGV